MFSTLSKTKIIILANFILSSANAFNLEQSTILSFGKELTLSQTTKFRLVHFERDCRRTILNFTKMAESSQKG